MKKIINELIRRIKVRKVKSAMCDLDMDMMFGAMSFKEYEAEHKELEEKLEKLKKV